jgi:hypothetical protein
MWGYLRARGRRSDGKLESREARKLEGWEAILYPDP